MNPDNHVSLESSLKFFRENFTHSLSETKLRALLKQGEGLRLEFKETFPKNAQDIAKEIVAFANTQGGTLLVGVKDNGEIVGISEEPDVVMRRLVGIVRDVCEPPLNPEIGHLNTVEKKCVVWMRVKTGESPCLAGEKYYIRVGSRVAVPTPEELGKIYNDPWRKIRGWLNKPPGGELEERIIALILSVVPGLGLIYRGRKWLGIIFFILTMIGYLTVLPGTPLHIIAVVLSGILSRPKKQR